MSNSNKVSERGRGVPIMSVSCPEADWNKFKEDMERFVVDYANLFGLSRSGLKSAAIRSIVSDATVYELADGRSVFGILVPVQGAAGAEQ